MPDEETTELDEETAELKAHARVHTSAPCHAAPAIYVAAIGASAGGLEALEELFSHMPLDTGVAFVVVQHLSPDHKSLMDELLGRRTALPVVVVQDQQVLQANTVYLLPPQKEMMVSNGKLLLTERELGELLSLPINIFFNSLAESYQDKGIAIVLSGTGSDGTKGIQAVHDSGGMTIAQRPNTCKFESMPRSAIQTHKIDMILAPAEIPEAMLRFVQRNERVGQQLAMGDWREEGNPLVEIVMLINRRYELDFSQYKMATISRRIERRMALLNLPTLNEYIQVLSQQENELEAMYYDLLIGVTEFFRDTEAFERLQCHLPKVLQVFMASQDDEFRVWVPGCATGEEAYSLGMLLCEIASTMEKPFRFKIFATDVHNNSIKKAALGLYPASSLKGVSDERQARYFTRVNGDQYRVNVSLRQRIVFAQHNLIRDAPFTKIHLISCRNLLIYFNQETQKKVLSLLTFALKNKGLLFLGPSETLGSHACHYGECDGKHKVFQKLREGQRRPLVSLIDFSPKILPSIQNISGKDQVISAKSRKALNILLQRYVPPSLLINVSGDVLHAFGDAGRFLQITPGETSLNLRNMVTGPARAVITQMLSHVTKTQQPVQTRFVEGFAQCNSANVIMQPLTDLPSDVDYLLVSISPNDEERVTVSVAPTTVSDEAVNTEVVNTGGAAIVAAGGLSARADEAAEVMAEESLVSRVSELEEELQFTRESLRTTVEELETSNEELQSSNEELMAANEELQSTNEELQSVNEELVTVNSEYQAKERERAEIAADEKGIVEASGIGILFLDDRLRIRKFSDMAADIFHLVSGDFNRPVDVISGSLLRNIIPDIQRVMRSGSLVEKEVHHENGSVYQMRIHRLDKAGAESGVVRGVILTFINITKLSISQRQCQQTENRFQSLVDALSDGYFEWKPSGDSLYISDTLKRKLGYAIEKKLNWSDILLEKFQPFLEKIRMLHAGETAEQLLSLRHATGQSLWMLCKCRVNESGQTRHCIEGQLVDMQAFKRLEDDLQIQMEHLKRSNDILEEFAYIVSHDLKAPLRHCLYSLDYLCEAKAREDEADIDQHIEDLRGYLKSLQTLIDDVIRFSRFRTQAKKTTQEDLNRIIEYVKPILESNFPNRKIKVHCDRLPVMRCDRSMMQHLFQNLLHNACKYNDKTCIEIEVRCQTSAERVLITFVDNGIGFDSRFAHDIFKPFTRLVSKSQYEGSGVGLAICKTIVEQHGDPSEGEHLGKNPTETSRRPSLDYARSSLT
ncbi:MAG: chemotaxis protein CheB, partial [Gammaproteobacteria bacterium]